MTKNHFGFLYCVIFTKKRYCDKFYLEGENMKYEFEVPGKIFGKARPRLNSYTGVVYTPTKTKDYEELIRQYFLIKNPGARTLESRVSVEIKAYFKIPSSASKNEKEEMLENKISPVKKPDIDNVVKIVLDALNKFVILDDIQVTKLTVEKEYAREEKLLIKIEEY